MIQKILKPALAVLLIYLSCAFVSWELNPANWGEYGRFVAVLLGVMCAGIVVAANEEWT